MQNFFLLFSVVICFAGNLFDLYFSNYDCHFSEKTQEKLRLKDSSFIRKTIPFKEGDLKDKNGNVYSYRYCLVISAVPYFISLVNLVLFVPLSLFNYFFNFISNYIMGLLGVIFLICRVVRLAIISICSQGLHL